MVFLGESPEIYMSYDKVLSQDVNFFINFQYSYGTTNRKSGTRKTKYFKQVKV